MDLAPRATIRRARGAELPLDASLRDRLEAATGVRAGVLAAAAVALAAGVVLRFAATGDLWLDEALAVNIAKLPLGDIPDALRHDGAPPLYYALLHGWMAIFGDGTVAVRVMSGLFGVAALPLAWAAGRRLGGRPAAEASLFLLAASPFAVRYATEARMYSLVVFLVLAGHLALLRALEQPTRPRLAAVSVVTGLLLLTHYWAIFLVGTVLAVLALDARRRGDPGGPARKVVSAVAAGFAALVPWLPVLAYQALNTGTPWAVPPGVMELRDTFVDFAGGYSRAGTALAVVFAGLVVLALVGRPAGRGVALGREGRPGARRLAFVATGTLGAAFVLGHVTGSAFVPRYASVVLGPFVLLLATGTTALLSDAMRRSVVAVAVVLGLIGGVSTVADTRTQAGDVAAALERLAEPGDVVAYCPDQLGPAVSRLLPPSIEQVTFPDFGAPQRVDWVDYSARNKASPPRRFAARLLGMAGPDANVFVVWGGGYRTLGRRCEALVAGLDTRRAEVLRVTVDWGSFERMTLVQFPPW